MCDLFQGAAPFDFIRRVWATMAATPKHTYQVLTRRPDRMAELSRDLPLLPNVWLGTSLENDAVLDRLDSLRATRAAVRFVSFEALIGSVAGADLADIQWAIVGGESGPRARPMGEHWVDVITIRAKRPEPHFSSSSEAGGIRKPWVEPIVVRQPAPQIDRAATG